jgi:hypothetical protein
MMVFPTLTQICCLIPCPIAFIVFAIPPLALALRRRRLAHRVLRETST